MSLPTVVIQCGGRGTARTGTLRWREARERAMHALVVVVIPERLQLSRQIDRIPEKDAVQVLAPDRADQTRYESRLAARDAPAVAVMHELAAQSPRYGYRRIRVFLARRGHVMSADRAHRLWRLHRLQVPKKRPRRRVATSRPRPLPANAMGQVWAYEFVFDACANGQQLKCLTVVDEFTRECLAIDVAGSIRSGRTNRSTAGSATSA